MIEIRANIERRWDEVLTDERQPALGEHLVVALLDVCPDLDHHALVNFL